MKEVQINETNGKKVHHGLFQNVSTFLLSKSRYVDVIQVLKKKIFCWLPMNMIPYQKRMHMKPRYVAMLANMEFA